MNIIKKQIHYLICAGIIMVPLLVFSSASANELPALHTFSATPAPTSSSNCSQGFSGAECSACDGISQVDSSQSCSSNSSGFDNLIKTVVNIMSVILGALAIIMIIVSGIRFATAGGNSQSVSSAKSTLIYALVGLVIAALAQVIVRWVIGTSSNITSSSVILLIHHLY